MAIRPAWTIKNNMIVKEEFEFTWNSGFSISQKQKNIKALHNAILCNKQETALEISSKSVNQLGKNIGAFSLKLNGIYVENVFQAAKKYELGGPFIDLLEVSPKLAKTDERHHNSGNLVSFIKDNEEWNINPKTSFYDYIYVNALIENFGRKLDLSDYVWFTDIEFNPKKSINCQARSVAIYKLLFNNNLFNILNDKDSWLKFCIENVKG